MLIKELFLINVSTKKALRTRLEMSEKWEFTFRK